MDDFNATQDLQFSGLSLSSISQEIDSNGTIFNLTLTPDSYTPGILSLALSADSITDNQGVKNPEVSRFIDFRPHRVREPDLILWWELNSSLSDSSGNGNNANGSLPVYQSSGRFGESVSFNGVDFGKSVLSNGVTFLYFCNF